MQYQFKTFKIYFFIFCSSIFLLAIFNLYIKQSTGNDSTISEYLINYQGGFTRRGLIGEICFQVASYFDLSLRFTIFLIQSLIYFIFIVITYLYIKDLPKNILTIIAIYSPVFLLYPIAEIEILARKELFLFVAFIFFLNFSNIKFSKNIPLIYIFVTFPIVVLIWEPAIFLFPFLAFIIIINNNNDTYKKIILKIILSFSSSILVFLYILTNVLSAEGNQIMRDLLMSNFGERCYLSCEILLRKSSIKSQFDGVISLLTPTILIRYFLVIIISFLPLLILFNNSQHKTKIKFLGTQKYFLWLILLLIPVLILFASGTDWGRWVNISYTFSLFLYLYLIKNNFIISNDKILFFDNFYKNKKKLFIILFIIFAFMWNPKTSMRGDIASNSLYKIVYNSSKKIFGFKGIRLFNESAIIRFHQKYFE